MLSDPEDDATEDADADAPNDVTCAICFEPVLKTKAPSPPSPLVSQDYSFPISPCGTYFF